MEKEFVPYELALRMKELGFNELCLAFYGDENDFSMDSSRKNNLFRKCECIVPLFSQAFRWFREKYDLHYQLIPFFSDKESHAVDYYLAIAQHRPPIQVKTFEDAELACLEKLCEIVEQQK